MSTTGENDQHCQALRRDGTPCQGRPTESGFCFAHSPDSNAWRAKGGNARSNGARAMKLLPARLIPIFERLLKVFEQLDAGTYDRQRAMAMASVASALVRIVNAGELEERVRELEATCAGIQQDGARWAR